MSVRASRGSFTDKGGVTVVLRKKGAASPRYWRASEVEVVDFDVHW